MITIEKNNDNLIIKSHYYYAQRMREIPGAFFDSENKVWICPFSSLDYVRNHFAGEIYFKDEELDLRIPKMSYGSKIKLPRMNTLTPFPYQEEGARFMIDRLVNNWFCINSDVVGAGKTIMSILAMKHFYDMGLYKIIILCKRSLKSQWKEEIEKFWDGCPEVFVTPETKKKRDEIYKKAKEISSCVLICNYQNFLNDEKEINSVNPRFAIIDEAHVIKSEKGKMHKKIASLTQGILTILLTGTPIMSRPEDIHGILDLAAKDYVGTYKEFKDRYLITEFGIYGEQVIGAKNLDELKRVLSGVMIRRTTEEISVDLPDVLPPIVRAAERDAVQDKMFQYLETLSEDLDKKKKAIIEKGLLTEEDKEKIAVLNEQGKVYIALKQFVSDDPRLVKESTSDFFAFEVLRKMLPKSYKMSDKQELTLDTIEEIVSSGEKVIVFCHFRTPAELLKKDIEEKLGYEVSLFTGKESDKAREENLNNFKVDTPILIGTEAMAEGLNLQFCSYMIHYEQGDTFAQREQRIGRIRRPKAKGTYCHIYDIVTKKSFDQVKLKKIEKDRILSEAMLGSL